MTSKLIRVIAKTGIRTNETIEEVGDELLVKTRAKPIDGEANKRIREMIAKFYKVSKSQVTLKRGDTSHIKFFEVDKN